MKTMKKMRSALVGALMLALAGPGAADAAAKKPRAELPARDVGERMERVERAIEQRRMKLTHFVWARYMEQAERARQTIDIDAFPGMNLPALCDTVPAIAALQRDFRAADSLYTEVLRADTAYERLRAEYVRVRDLKQTDVRRRPNYEGYQAMYARLRSGNPDYPPACEALQEAKRLRNLAIARWFGAFYETAGRPIPYTGLLTRFGAPMKALREEWPEIGRLEQEIAVLEKLRSELFERQQREVLDLEEPRRTEELPEALR